MDSRWDPNAQVECPYDPLHIISVKRYQHHIVKCRKNHPHLDFVPCPFNAKHQVLRHELKTHLAHCADRVVLEHDINQGHCPETGEMFRLKGNTDIPDGNYYVPETNENWDDEIEVNQAEQLEDQQITCRRNYEGNGHALRRPNTLPGPAQNPTDHTSDADDAVSLCSLSSRTSSLYMDPVKWNNTHQWKPGHSRDQQQQQQPEINSNSRNNSTENRTMMGRGGLTVMNKMQNGNYSSLQSKTPSGCGGHTVNSINKTQSNDSKTSFGNQQMRGVQTLSSSSDSIKKPFGRGALRQTLEMYRNTLG